MHHINMRFAGSLSREERDKALFEIIGVPFDGNAVRKGAARAPRAVRRASHTLETFLWQRKEDISEMRFYDAGDISVSFPPLHQMTPKFQQGKTKPHGTAPRRSNASNEMRGEERTESDLIGCSHAGAVRDADAVRRDADTKIFIGGDHSVSVALVSTLCKHDVIFMIDAHADFRDEYMGNRYSNACTARRIAEIVGFQNVVLIGVRSASAEEYDALRERGVRVYDAEEILSDLKGVLSEINNAANADNAANAATDRTHGMNRKSVQCYISVDIDVLDPSIAPGVEYPEPCGLSIQHVIAILKNIIRTNDVVAADVVEVNPRRDITGTTSISAARIVMEMIAELHEKYAR